MHIFIWENHSTSVVTGIEFCIMLVNVYIQQLHYFLVCA